MKTCTKCKIDKEFDAFGKYKRSKDNLRPKCKECRKIYYKENNIKVQKYQKDNAEKIYKYNKQYVKTNSHIIKRNSKLYRLENKDKIRQSQKQYYQDNKENLREKGNERSNLYYRNNLKICKERSAEYRKNNRDKANLASGKYRENNRGKCNALAAKYRASKLNATLPYTTNDKIKVLYEKCKWLESLTGLKYHVDHVIPLQGNNVSGLHVWENLQILEASENVSKSNKYTGDK